ncbi:hypothetical protein [Deinococcus sp. Marseille-Q6407]|uniref:hypothetical protein n=1 Tax=Deinococcus sp. Marseille-Q6407 TaxID=2969223 RepID=UPI0021C17BB7|nr:hypothetical protein [Deinococcus sp. Marseille-Q6407]
MTAAHFTSPQTMPPQGPAEFAPINHLGMLWPVFVLAERQGAGTAEETALDLVVPQDPEQLRALYLAVLNRVDPVAAAGLLVTSSEELAEWSRVLREPVLTGDAEELRMLPAAFFQDGRMRRGLVALLWLPLWERLDVFQTAMHMAAERAA